MTAMPEARSASRRATLTLVAAMLAAGCVGDIEVTAGRDPNLAALDDTLVLGASTVQEVQAALGEPFGWGRAMMPFHDAPRDVLAYYEERGSMEDDRRTILWVFLRDGVYDGHIWFSSLPDP